MTIQPTGPSLSRTEGTAPTRTTPGVARVSDESQLRQTEAQAAGQRDVLDLSPAARALVARSDEDGSLSAERLLQIRQRILDGTYDSPAVLDSVASALRSSGDLR
jgi:anti-sigma28 factor (negative regulator of flagellin synthesis)